MRAFDGGPVAFTCTQSETTIVKTVKNVTGPRNSFWIMKFR